MERVDGRSIWNGALPEIGKGERRAFYEAMIDALARLHSLDHEKIGLGGFGRAGNYFERPVGRWTQQYRAAQTDHKIARATFRGSVSQYIMIPVVACSYTNKKPNTCHTRRLYINNRASQDTQRYVVRT